MRAANLTALLFLLAAPATARATPPLVLTTGFSGQAITDRSWDLVDVDDHLPMAHVAAGWAFDVSGGRLEASLGFLSGSTRATLHDSHEAALMLRSLELGATFRHPFARRFEPYVRLAGGFDWATLSIGSEGTLEQRIARPSATAMLGAAIPLVVTTSSLSGRRHEWLLLDLGVGYTVRPSFDFDALAPAEPDRPAADGIARTPTDLGQLAMSGVAYRLGLTLRL